MGPVQVGVRSTARVHHQGDGPGLLGAAIYVVISEGSVRDTQSPGRWMSCLPKLLDIRWPASGQLMSLVGSALQALPIGAFPFCFVWRATQPPGRSLPAHCVTAHILLHSPTVDVVIPPTFPPPLPPPAFRILPDSLAQP